MISRLKKLYVKARSASSGSTLLMVIITAAVAVALIAAVTTSVLSTNTVSAQNVKAQQAYFTARSAVNATVKYLSTLSDSDLDTLIKSGCTGSGSISDLGDYTVNIAKIDNDAEGNPRIIITATAYYPNKETGVAGTASRYLDDLNGSGSNSSTNPLNNLIYIGNSSGSSINPSQCIGDIVFNGPLTLSSGSSIDGNIFVNGKLTMSGGSSVKQNAYVNGNLDMSGGSSIAKNAYINGSLGISGGSSIIQSAYAADGFSVTGGSTVGAQVTTSGSTAVIPLVSNEADTALPSAVSAAVRSSIIDVTHSTTSITASGTLGSCQNWADTTTAVTVDTTKSDIYLLVTKALDLSSRQFYVTGSNHLYIYLEGSGTTLSLSGGSPVIRMKDSSQNSTIFVIGGKGTSLALHSAEIQGSVYIPEGSVTIDGGVGSNGMQTGYALVGSMAANTAAIGSNVYLEYAEPNLDGTPLSSLLPSRWSLGSWS